MATLQKELAHLARAFQDAKEKRKGAIRDATVTVCLVVRAAARVAARNGETSVKVNWTPTDQTLLSGPSYTGIAKDDDFRKGVDAMLVHDFGASMSTRTKARAKTKSDAYNADDFITVHMLWNVAASTTQLAAPQISNVSFECPVCLEDKPANILVPCGHHACGRCVSRIRMGSDTIPKCCPVCKSAIALERVVYATMSKRKRKEPPPYKAKQDGVVE